MQKPKFISTCFIILDVMEQSLQTHLMFCPESLQDASEYPVVVFWFLDFVWVQTLLYFPLRWSPPLPPSPFTLWANPLLSPTDATIFVFFLKFSLKRNVFQLILSIFMSKLHFTWYIFFIFFILKMYFLFKAHRCEIVRKNCMRKATLLLH